MNKVSSWRQVGPYLVDLDIDNGSIDCGLETVYLRIIVPETARHSWDLVANALDGLKDDVGFSYADSFTINDELDTLKVRVWLLKPKFEELLEIGLLSWLERFCSLLSASYDHLNPRPKPTPKIK